MLKIYNVWGFSLIYPLHEPDQHFLIEDSGNFPWTRFPLKGMLKQRNHPGTTTATFSCHGNLLQTPILHYPKTKTNQKESQQVGLGPPGARAGMGPVGGARWSPRGPVEPASPRSPRSPVRSSIVQYFAVLCSPK